MVLGIVQLRDTPVDVLHTAAEGAGGPAMMRWVVGTSLRSRGLVVVLGLIVMIFGITRAQEMPRDVLPEFNRVTVEVQSEALGLSAQEVEALITAPLEQDLLSGVAFLDFIRSESVPGLSKIEMIFEPGTDEGHARQVVNERLTQAFANPNVSSPPQMLRPRSSTSQRDDDRPRVGRPIAH